MLFAGRSNLLRLVYFHTDAQKFLTLRRREAKAQGRANENNEFPGKSECFVLGVSITCHVEERCGRMRL
jgi:hypothetical protein